MGSSSTRDQIQSPAGASLSTAPREVPHAISFNTIFTVTPVFSVSLTVTDFMIKPRSLQENIPSQILQKRLNAKVVHCLATHTRHAGDQLHPCASHGWKWVISKHKCGVYWEDTGSLIGSKVRQSCQMSWSPRTKIEKAIGKQESHTPHLPSPDLSPPWGSRIRTPLCRFLFFSLYIAAIFASLAQDEKWAEGEKWPQETNVEFTAHVVKSVREFCITSPKLRNHWPGLSEISFLAPINWAQWYQGSHGRVSN